MAASAATAKRVMADLLYYSYNTDARGRKSTPSHDQPSAFATASRERAWSAQKSLTPRPASFSWSTVRCEFQPLPKSCAPVALRMPLCVSTSRVRSPSGNSS